MRTGGGLCDETDPEYDLRFDADEEYVRELIDRIEGMSLRRVKLCNRRTRKAPWEVGKGTWQGAERGLRAECRATFVFAEGCGCGAEDEPWPRLKPMNGN